MKFFLDKESDLNPYFEKFKTHQFIVENNENLFSYIYLIMELFY